MFLQSFEQTVQDYRMLLTEARAGRLMLPNNNLDTGQPSRAGRYKLADTTYAKLVDKLAEHDFETVTPELRAIVLAYFKDADKAALSRRPRETLTP